MYLQAMGHITAMLCTDNDYCVHTPAVVFAGFVLHLRHLWLIQNGYKLRVNLLKIEDLILNFHFDFLHCHDFAHRNRDFCQFLAYPVQHSASEP